MKTCFICKSAELCEHREQPLLTIRERNRLAFTQSFLKEDHPRLAEEEKRHRARQVLASAVRCGKFPKLKHCQMCGVGCVTDGHHCNYDAPLDVIWLCRQCHSIADQMMRAKEKSEKLPVESGGKKLTGQDLSVERTLNHKVLIPEEDC